MEGGEEVERGRGQWEAGKERRRSRRRGIEEEGGEGKRGRQRWRRRWRWKRRGMVVVVRTAAHLVVRLAVVPHGGAPGGVWKEVKR